MNSVPSNLWEWLAPIEPDERFALTVTTIVIGLAATVLIAAIFSWTISYIQKLRIETALKRDLLDRGLSADDIAKVIEATGSRGKQNADRGGG